MNESSFEHELNTPFAGMREEPAGRVGRILRDREKAIITLRAAGIQVSDESSDRDIAMAMRQYSERNKPKPS